MKEIEKYIHFAIDNGYNDKWFWGNIKIECIWNYQWSLKCIKEEGIFQWICIEVSSWKENKIYSLYETITSKPFIEAVANWIQKKQTKYKWMLDLMDEICLNQAIAIRDNKLKEFINNLI